MKTSLFAAAVAVLFSISGQAGMEDIRKKGEVTMNPIAEDTRIFKINPEFATSQRARHGGKLGRRKNAKIIKLWRNTSPHSPNIININFL